MLFQQTCPSVLLEAITFLKALYDNLKKSDNALSEIFENLRGEIKNKRDFCRSSAQPHRRGLLIK